MKRPKTNSKKISWFSIAGVFLLAVALAVGVCTNAQAATGSLDRDNYFPSLGDTNDFDRAFITVIDTSITTVTVDTITVTVKAVGSNNSTDFVLQETGGTTSVFTTTGRTQPGQIGVGTNTGYAPDFQGAHLYPALGASTAGTTLGVTALNLKSFETLIGGNAVTSTNGSLNVVSGDTLQLLYGGSTLDTAVVGFNGANNTTITFTKGATWGDTAAGPADDTAVVNNFIITVSDPDENLNPKMKDCIGFQDGFRAGLTGTASSRVQVEAIDQSTGNTLSVGGVSVVARNIMLTETGNSTGIFTAAGKVYGSSTAAILRGNIYVAGTATASFMGGDGTGTTGRLSDGSYPYTGGFITLGSTTTTAQTSNTVNRPAVGFKILEITASGRIGLIFTGTSTLAGGAGTATLAYQASTGAFADASGGFGSSTWSGTRVVAVGTNSTAYGIPTTSGNTGSGTPNLLKLIDGSNYCLVQMGTYTPAGDLNATTTTALAVGATFEGANNAYGAGSITVTIGSFIVTGPRGSDSIKVSYLDEIRSTGTAGTVTSSTAFGTTGETGTIAVDKTSVDINDFLTITVVDGNLNASSSTQSSVASGAWDGTTTNSRGDRLTVAGYTQGLTQIAVSHPDGNRVGTQSIRISNSDNSLVWIVPNTYGNISTLGFGDQLTPGSSSFRLGTQSTSVSPLVALTKGVSADATSFLSGAGASSFTATTDAVNGTVEISPDGTHWVAVPITETGVNSSTFVGTIGFDFTAARVTINTSSANSTTIFSDQTTGTSSIIFVSPEDATSLRRTIGTGSVVRISDGLFSEFREVTGIFGSTLSVTKMTNTSLFTPWKTFVQVIGNDMSPTREDTVSGSKLFRIGGYFGATYRVRYNDALNASGVYAGGATLAATTSDVVFTTSTGALSTSPSGTTGVNSTIVVTLVDNDLNTSAATAQATFTDTTTLPVNLNEVGLGFPSGTSTGNSAATSDDLAKKNGGAAKVVFASNKSSVTSSNITDASSANSTHFALTETAANSGTFKGSFILSSTIATNQDGVGSAVAGVPNLKVTSGDIVTVFYNDSPSASVENNLKSLTSTSFIVQSGIGSLSLSKSEAFLNGDSVVVTVNDSDINASTTTSESTSAFVTSSSGAGSITVALAESTASSGLFVGTFRTSTTTDSTASPKTIRAVAGGTVTVTYQDASPAQDITALVSTKNFGAALDITTASVALGGNAVVSLRDQETNTSISTANVASLNIRSTTDSTGTIVVLTETGAATGSFLGTIKVSTDSSLSNTNIKAAVGDTLTATFTDNPDASGLSSVVTDTALVTSAAATPTPTPTATPTPTPTPTPAPGTGSITGVVVSTALAAPVSGATVSTNTGGFTATTAADGKYTISNVTPGSYTLTASKTGFASSSQSVTVTAGVTTTANFDLSAAATPTPTATATPKPTATATPKPTATPVPCEPEKISASPPKSLTLKTNASGNVTVTVTGEKDCESEGVTVTATTNTAGAKRISISPASAKTDKNGEVVFKITAKTKTGNARITFKAGTLKKPLRYTVKVTK